MRQLSKVYVHGGGDCPEKTLTGILKALQISLPSSFIYVFTDARSKDYHLEDEVLNTIQEKQSSVVFVMTGDCGNRTHPGFRTYEKIAAASFGQVFHLEKSDVSTVLEYVRHAVKQKKVHLMYEARERGGTVSRNIPVDKHLSELTISLSGDKDDSDNLDIVLRDPEGRTVDKRLYSKEGGTIDLKNVKLIRLKDPSPGVWTVNTNSRLKHTIRVFGHGAVDFKYGFASRPLDRIELARPRPVLNQDTYLLINMTGLIPPGTVGEIDLVDYHGHSLYKAVASPHRTNPNMYFAGPFVPPKGLFFVRVQGYDEDNYEFMRIAPTAIGSVIVGGPRAFMSPIHQEFVGRDLNLSCTVESASAYTIYWVKTGEDIIGGPLFYHNTDTSVWTIPELSLKDAGEYECRVISNNGNYSVKTRVETRESPPEIFGVRNVSVPLGEAAFLHCSTRSAGEVEIRWTRYGATVFNGPNTERNPTNGTLKIHHVTRADAGVYECMARNAGGMSTRKMRLDIMEPPSVKVTPQDVYFNMREGVNLSCEAMGDPKPEVHWYFKGRHLLNDYKYQVGQDSKFLYIRDATHHDEGTYECRAMSQAGQARDTTDLMLATPPKVEIIQNKMMVGRGDRVSFECKTIRGKPHPKIRWFKNGKDLIKPDDYIKINEGQLHIMGAKDEDAGAYSCVGENMAGKDVQVANLSVGRVPTIIESPHTVRVNIERQVTLQCLAVGIPPPEIEWQKGNVLLATLNNPRYTQLADGNLLITDAQIEDQGQFTCIARNTYGQQSQSTTLMVTGLVSPVLGHVPPEEQLIEGQDLTLSCVVVLGTPKPSIVWIKDDKPVEEGPTIKIEGGGSLLRLRGGNPKDEGKYTCIAVSPAGNSTLHINVQLIKKPEFVYKPEGGIVFKPTISGMDEKHVAVVNSTHDVLDGEGFAIPCVVSGTPPPIITWYLDGRPITPNSRDFTVTADNTLIVRKADKSYSGVYTCQATNSAGDNEQKTTIRIMNTPMISPGQSSFNMVVDDLFTIPCDVYGDPKPVITWLLDDKPFTEGVVNEDGSLTIPNVNEAHRGTFTCHAQNAAGNDTRTVTLTVHTTPTINAENQEKIALQNDDIVLECPAKALPPPVRLWTYEGEKIDSQLIPHTIREDGALVLQNVKLENTGVFVCQVSNLAGEDSLSYTLTVHEKPKIISEVPGVVDVVKGFTIEIPCRATGVPEVIRTWNKNGIDLKMDEKKFSVDNLGTLRIYEADKNDIGNYNCVVTNEAGTSQMTTHVDVQEPPIILPSTQTNNTAVVGDRVELKCYVEASPPASVTWFRRGIAIGTDTKGYVVESDGTLVIQSASVEDATIYTCKASNPAGKAEANLQVTVIASPDIKDPDVVTQESIKESHPFSLYCPVFSNPLPQISWYLNDKPLIDDKTSWKTSDDKRKLHVFKAKITDSGVYKCVARNAAGEGSKSFQVEVIVPLNLDESKYKKKVFAKEGEEVTLGCPVSGFPVPQINWVVDGTVVEPGKKYKGATLSNDGLTLHFDSVSVKQEGNYHCVAQSKGNILDIDVELSVLAVPIVGEDDNLEVFLGKDISLSCDLQTESDDKTTFVWSINGSESDRPDNVQIPSDGHRLYITDAKPENNGKYMCRVTNSAGKAERTLTLDVLEPPVFVEPVFEANQKLIGNNPIILQCQVTGNPKPTVIWKIDGNDVDKSWLFDESLSLLRIEKLTGKSAQISCTAENKAGTASRDFFIQNIAAPTFKNEGDQETIFRESETITLDCPVSLGDFQITWMKQGLPLTENDAIFTLDNTRLTILNANRDHEDIYTCVANNTAGQVSKDFDVVVQVLPKIKNAVVTLEINEGEEIILTCDAEGNPTPTAKWDFNQGDLPKEAVFVNNNHTVVVNNVTKYHTGVYKCYATNKVGQAVKTINVHVRTKPRFESGLTESELTVNLTRSITLECDVDDAIGVGISWTVNGKPFLAETDGVQTLAGGRFLHIVSAKTDDHGSYACTVTNEAGVATKTFNLFVQVPPTIVNEGGEYTVIENNSLVLPCEVTGKPNPVVTWTKDGRPVGDLKSVQVLSEGQQFKIVHAEIAHKGSYICMAKNDVGTAEISFDVDIITRPMIQKGIKNIVTAIKGGALPFKCPIDDDKNFKGQIIWLRNYQPIDLEAEDARITRLSNDRRLTILNVTENDEGQYSCRVKNDAGENSFDFKATVLVPPTIIMLDKDKNKTAVEHSTVTLSCPATGKPEPDITWFKDGEAIHIENIADIIPNGELNGNQLKITRIKEGDAGKYTCEADNSAGSVEQDVNVNVITIPKIEKDGIPSDYESQQNERVVISCPVYARPPAKITWLKAGKPLQSDKFVKTSANGQKLYLFKLRETDSSKYTCIATNEAGTDKRDFKVSMLVAPSFDEPNIVRRITVNSGNPSTLHCPAKGSPSPTITWLKDGNAIEPNDRYVFFDAGRQLQISKTEGSDQGRYTCIATNSVGSDDLENTLEVIIPPVIDGERREAVAVIEGFSSELFCDSNSTGVDVEWQKDGLTINQDTLRGDSFIQIPSSGKKMSFLSARKSDSGRYTCIVRNPAGEARKLFDFAVNDPPSISDELSSANIQTIVPYYPVEINCVVSGSPHPKVYWLFDDKPLEPDSAAYELTNNGETLKIVRSQVEHAGTYTCEAQNNVGKARKDFLVRVTAPPHFEKEREEVVARVGDTMLLTCNAESSVPLSSVYWHAHDESVQNGVITSKYAANEKTLNVTNIQLDDEGFYYCTAVNEAGITKKFFKLIVIETPYFLDQQKLYPIILGKRLTLDCSATGTPPPTILFMKDGKRLNESDEVDIIGSTLVIDNPQKEVEGRYTCIAENKAGRSEKDMMVEVLLPPKLSKEWINVEVQAGDPLTLECPIEDTSGVHITWSRQFGKDGQLDMRAQSSSDKSKLYIMQATPEDADSYSCIAVNDAGGAEAVFQVTVNTPPKIFGDSFSTTEIVADTTLEIPCRTEGIPPPEISWFLDGKPILEMPGVTYKQGDLSLRIDNIKPNQEGRYTCVAENKAGRAEQDTYVEISEPPRVVMASEVMRVVEGRQTTIRCEVFGNPEPVVNWLKDGEPYTSDLLQFSTKLSYLHLRETTLADGGTYTCIATNKAGESQTTTDVEVLVPPRIEDEERVLQGKEGNTYMVHCQVTGRPVPYVTWKRNGKEIEQFNPVLHIRNATRADEGKYSCIASNEAGTAVADFLIDVFTKPTFETHETTFNIVEGESAKIECKIDGHPKPTISWLKGGRPFNMDNIILSPRGDTLMILKAQRFDGGLYTCVATNSYGDSEQDFKVNVYTKPYIDETIDQTPKAVAGGEIILKCPVLGNPTPTVTWKRGDDAVPNDSRHTIVNNYDLKINSVTTEDAGQYSCIAVNEAGNLTTHYAAEVIGKPTFVRKGGNLYEVIENDTITMDCGVTSRPLPSISWFRGDKPVYLYDRYSISPDGSHITINKAKLSDGGKYICRASNEAGTSDIDLILKILVPPKIDKSNIIGNPLAIVARTIYLECPISGIPQPDVIWTKNGMDINMTDSRVILAQNNETFGIENVQVTDQGRYTCTATNRGGKASHDFSLDVLSPPEFDIHGTQPTIKREGDTITLTCPIKLAEDIADQVMDVSWTKDSRALDGDLTDNVDISDDGRKLTISQASLENAGLYTCIALNRAGEASLEFKVEILSPPVIDISRNDVQPQVAVNQPTIMRCAVTGHPFPSIKWLKNGKEVTDDENIRIVEQGQVLQILRTDSDHAGKWSCVAENDAGVKELEMVLDVFTPPVVSVKSDNPIKALGETITLFCNASGNPYPQLKWAKGGSLIFDSPDGARISLKGARLDIPHLKKTDVGDYTCQALNAAGTSEASVSVDVLVPPEINRDGIDMSPRLPAQQSLTLQCLAQGKPVPQMRWTLNGTALTHSTPGITVASDSTFIQINNVSLSDKGVYTCYAENVAGSDNLMYNVDVVQAPVISNGGTKQVIEGELAVIECLVEGYPAPQVSWLRNGNRVETGVQGVRYVTDGRMLTIIEARSLDSGIYLCSATNEAGSAQQAYTLEVLVSPKIITSTPGVLTPSSGSKFSLPCAVRGYPDPIISWTLNGNDIKDGENGHTIGADGTLHIEKAEERHLIYECTAKNDAGADTLEFPVQTIVAPKISTSGNRYINGSEGTETVIKCEIESESSEFSWSKNGVPLLPSNNLIFSEDYKLIKILSTRLSDQGEYSCTAANKAGNATQKTNLNVGVAPKIMERPRTQVVHKGDQVTLWCEASGVPQPAITWYKDNELLTNTGVDETATTKKKSVIFSSISPSQAGVYTCKAENWVASTEEDIDLIVMIPPEVVPERMNVSTNPRQTVFLSCNATGIPEPVISWMRDSNIAIQNNEKYQILGTTLAIRNVLPDDDGFYHCIAKSDAGQKIATRKLIVNKPSDRPAPIWVECDEKGKPKKTEYMIDRGDTPDDNPQLLPWKDVEDSSLNGSIAYRCMPGPRSSRTVLLHAAPQFIVKPKNTTAAIGAIVELRCSAAGPPHPTITWAKDGKLIEDSKFEIAYSHLKVTLNSTSDSGEYTCMAQNSVGSSTVSAFINVDNNILPTPKPSSNQKNVAVITCYERNQAYSRGLTWEYNGVPMPKNLAGIHFMNNGSLVILDTSSLKEGDLELYTCKVRNRRRHSIPHLTSAFEGVPEVKTIDKVEVNNGDSVVLDCEVTSDPLTTHVVWTKNDQKMLDDDAIYVLPNNSLVLLNVEKYDEGVYKCVASNSIGKAFDDTQLNVYEGDFLPLTGFEGSGINIDDSSNAGGSSRREAYKKENEDASTTTITTTSPTTTTTETPLTTTIIPALITLPAKQYPTDDYHEGSANDDGFGPTTQDSLFEFNPPLHPEISVVNTDCAGTINENGDCVDKDGKTHNLKILTGENHCPEGFAMNPHTRICEDLDECAFYQPCDFECINYDGGFQCNCPLGYELAEEGCRDVNECESVRCEDGKACFNQLGGYECIDDPCPANYSLVDDRYCEPECENCTSTPIQVHMLAIPSGLPISHIATLTAYDKSGRVLNDTTYAISDTGAPLARGRMTSGPFTIKAVKRGHAQVWTNRVLAAGDHHKVRVRAHSDHATNELHAPKETNFLVLINVGQYPF
ncbi:Ig-like domain-containing protein [Caenorhabditis elegans]|nr:Ig-like domain-containing protein [Caenorhabditis elegans]VTW47455.1 Ig-like domain-containing protein [Caenorhabditis elegans]